jgi:hypothetical protein
MSQVSKYVAGCALALALGASAPAFAQQRVQEENLVYTDPTMAPAGTFLAGIAGEFWGLGSALEYPVNTGTGSQTKTRAIMRLLT